MAAPVWTAMELTSVLALMATRGSTARTWYVGVIQGPVRTEGLAGSRGHHTPVNARLAGLDSTATSPVYPVKWPPSSKVWR